MMVSTLGMQTGISRITQMGKKSINGLGDGFGHVGIATQLMAKKRGVGKTMMMALEIFAARVVVGSGVESERQPTISTIFPSSFSPFVLAHE